MPAACPLRALADRRLLLHALAWTVVAGLAFGLVAAIIPNPVFGRSIAPEPVAIWTWLLSAPLMGLVMATTTAPPPPPTSPSALRIVPLAAGGADAVGVADRRSSTLGWLAGLGTFLAIGCPVCNKAALLLLGASGAMGVWAPIQPVLGVVSLGLLAATAAWRLRLRAMGAACPA